jgi:hypothetical protein
MRRREEGEKGTDRLLEIERVVVSEFRFPALSPHSLRLLALVHQLEILPPPPTLIPCTPPFSLPSLQLSLPPLLLSSTMSPAPSPRFAPFAPNPASRPENVGVRTTMSPCSPPSPVALTPSLPQRTSPDAVETYFPLRAIDEADLERFDGVSAGKYTIGLGVERMAFCDDREDINSFLLNGQLSFYAFDRRRKLDGAG